MADDIRMGSGGENLGAFVERLAPGDEVRAWLDVLPAEKRSWALRCMIAASAGGVGRLNIDPATFAALLRAEILSIADLQRRLDHDLLAKVPGIGPRRVARIARALATYAHDNG